MSESDDVVIELAPDMQSATIVLAGRPWIRVSIVVDRMRSSPPRLRLVELETSEPKR